MVLNRGGPNQIFALIVFPALLPSPESREVGRVVMMQIHTCCSLQAVTAMPVVISH